MDDIKPIIPMLKQIHVNSEKYINNILKDKDITLSQGRVLGFIYKSENSIASFKSVEELLSVAQSTTVGIVSRLEKKGFVEVFASPTDKRMKMLKLTALGEQTIEYLMSIFNTIEEDIFKDFSLAEKLMLIQLLKKIKFSQERNPAIENKEELCQK